MPRKKSYITVTDQFCGAGGSSHGVRNYANRKGGGIEISLALNHWDLAIETHNTNFPDTLHDCTDISACDPRRYPSTDILITSPECTNHSDAKGQKRLKAQMEMFAKGELDPAAERSRATMWDVPRFAEYHKYNIIIVENVVQARKWVLWDSWIHAMSLLGYDYKCVYLNSMFCHPTPQSRDRLYVVFWKKGNRKPDLDIKPPAYCTCCSKNIEAFQSWKKNDFKWGKYRTQYVYRCPDCLNEVTPYYYAAFNAIDWSDPGTRIGDRERLNKKPLTPNTMRRIKHGREKYWKDPAVLIKNYGGECDPRNTPVDIKSHMGTITTSDHHAILNMPFIIQTDQSKCAPSGKIKNVAEPFQVQTTRQTMGLLMPFITEMNRTGKARGVDEPLATILTSGSHHGICSPFIVESKGMSNSSPITDELACITTKSYHGLLTPEAFNSFISYNYNGNQTSHILESMDTVTPTDRMSLVKAMPAIEDCYYRMLKAHEVGAGMAFDKDYVVLGTQRDQVRQYGNAVTPPAMEELASRCIESLS